MNPYIEKLKAYLKDRPVNCHWEDAQSILDLLCHIYVEQNSVDNSTITYHYRELDQLWDKFTMQEYNQLNAVVFDLCSEYMRQAFLSGVHVGFQLDTELRGDRQ